MIHLTCDQSQPKGWLVGPWNSNVTLPIGYANAGIDETHYHTQMYEIYLVARGQSTAIVEDEEIMLQAGSILVIEPNEIHTFIHSSDDYLHFVIHTPFVRNDKTICP